MKSMKRIPAFFLSFTVATVFTTTSFAQPSAHWKQIGLLTTIGGGAVAGTSGYFWNAEHGLVGTVNGSIFYTMNAGDTWQQSATPIASGFAFMTTIYMEDSLTGYAGVYSYTNIIPALWKTTDGGVTWASTGYMSGGPLGSDLSTGVTDISSTRSGNLIVLSWKRNLNFPSGNAMAISWLNSSEGIITTEGNDRTNNYITKDGGGNWNPVAISPAEAWGVAGIPKWKSYILAPEGGGPGAHLYAANIYILNANGTAWVPTSMTGSWTGDVEAGPAVVYVQGSNGAPPGGGGGYLPTPGLYRSTDTGRTWVSVGGPSNGVDTRFCVTGCDGSVVVAFDDSGGVWETTDGGDGTLGRSVPQLSSTSLTIAAKRCEQNTKSLTLEGFECNPFVLDSISFLDSTLLRSGALSLDSLPTLPETFDSGYVDLIKFRWNPSAYFTRDTTVTDSVRLSYLDGASGTYRDTVLVLTLSAQAPSLATSIPTTLGFSSVSTCAFLDSTFAIVNNGCDTIHLDSTVLKSNAFSVLKADSIIPPGDTGYVSVHYQPLGTGSDQGNISVYFHSNDAHAFDVTQLSGTGVQGSGVLAMRSTSLLAGSLSFCSGDTLVTDTLRNLDCDTLVLTDLHLSGDTAFSLVSVPDSLLLPGDSAIVTIQFAPRLKGPHAAMLTFHERNIVNDPGHDTTVTISGFGLGGPTALSADTTTRDFGALFACESRDTTLWLANPGCDTLTVDTAMFSSPALSSLTALPSLLPPGDSVPVIVQLAASPTNTVGTVTFYSNANSGSPTATVPFEATIMRPLSLTLSLSPAAAAHAGQTVTIYVTLTGDTGAAARSLTGLRFVLTHNDDLLALQNASGLSWSPGSATTTRSDTFAWKVGLEAPTHADTIGTLSFRVYLTDSAATPLALSDISLEADGTTPADCIASVDSTGSGFTYVSRCGEHELQGFMRTGMVPFSIDRIVPNPAVTSVTVEGSGRGVQAEVMDALGRTRIPSARHDLPFTLPVQTLPSGVYLLRISCGGFIAIRPIAIAR